jgi:pyridoxine kinase
MIGCAPFHGANPFLGILSIQSQVVAGHVGNSAAVFALQRLGREVWAVPTVLLSHHPGHGGAQGGVLPPGLLADLLAGFAARKGFARCEAVISGYLGQAAVAGIVRDAVAQARAADKNTIYLCDPVLGDDGHTYVSHEVVTSMHNLAAMGDIVTPNDYELFLLTGQRFFNRAGALGAMRVLQARGPRLVILTSFSGADTAPGMIDVLAADGAQAWRVSVPRLAQKFSGAGDLFAALFLHFYLSARDAAAALGQACAVLAGVLEQTARMQADELALIAAQNLLAMPEQKFAVERLV